MNRFQYRIYLMKEGRGSAEVKNYTASVWQLRVLFWGVLLLFSFLGLYSFNSYRTLSGINDQGLELEMLRSEKAQGIRQIEAINERLVDLDRKMVLLKEHEEDLSLLTREYNRQLGLPDTAKLAEIWPALIETVAWTWGGSGAKGGLDTSVQTEYEKSPVEIVRALHRDLDRLETSASAADLALSELTAALSGSKNLLSATPQVLPLSNPRLTSGFGYRTSPFGGRGLDLHRGLDLAAPVGTNVYAPADGTVLAADWSNNGYGLMLTVDHGFGLVTRYAHLSESLVEAGALVIRGQLIAKVGNTGRSTGPHLHYEAVLGGVPVDPFIFAKSGDNILLEASADN